ncbi:hypothetical protein IFM89_007294 [Coptis chinensis]|uniref:Deoxyhypusine hydroxylase n=1 Tax=Coptis chinensis TaxID=261450 RepID=A0A835LAE4_9MAGN|nr:hypothetical protein IFM89_007294 [Coptis chinensis]
MVRHEAAEALGSIADSQSVELLEEFAKDVEPIVSQSCEVALSMLEFENLESPLSISSCRHLSDFLHANPPHESSATMTSLSITELQVYDSWEMLFSTENIASESFKWFIDLDVWHCISSCTNLPTRDPQSWL